MSDIAVLTNTEMKQRVLCHAFTMNCTFAPIGFSFVSLTSSNGFRRTVISVFINKLFCDYKPLYKTCKS